MGRSAAVGLVACLPWFASGAEPQCKEDSHWALTQKDAEADAGAPPAGIEITQMWPGISGNNCQDAGDLRLTATWDGTFLIWPGGKTGEAGNWTLPGWATIDPRPVFGMPVAAGDEVAVRLPADFSGVLAFSGSEAPGGEGGGAGANLSVSTPVLSAWPEVLAVGARAWADRGAVFARVPPALRGASYWPGTGHTLPGGAAADLDVAAEGTAFVLCGEARPAGLGYGWVEVQPPAVAAEAAGEVELTVWARPVVPGPGVRLLEPAEDLEGVIVAFRPAVHMPTPDFGIDALGTPGAAPTPRALTPGAQLWPGSSVLVSEVPDVLAGHPYWPTGDPKDTVFESGVDGTLVVFLDPDAPPAPTPWTGAGPIGVVGQGDPELVGWARPIRRSESVTASWPGQGAERSVIVFVPDSETSVNVIEALASRSGAVPASAPSAASVVTVENNSSHTETKHVTTTTATEDKLGMLVMAILAGVVGAAIFGGVYYFFLRRRRHERFADSADDRSSLPPIILTSSKVSGMDTE